jgi:spermidine synthase
MIKVGEHITLDFLGVKKDYSPEFYEKVIYKIAKAAKVEILNVASHKFEPQGFYISCLIVRKSF